MKAANAPLFVLLCFVGCATLKDRPEDPKLVAMAAAIRHPVLPAAEASKTQVVLRIQASAPEMMERQPIHVAVLLDASGSMASEAIGQAKDAAYDLVRRLERHDRVTFVAFNTQAHVLARSTRLDDLDLDELKRDLDGIEAIGTTNLSAALSVASTALAERPATEEIRRLVLLSDGRPNTPANVDAHISSLASAKIPVTALGYGLDYDELLLARAARTTGGHYQFIEKPEALASVFDREVLRLRHIVAQSAVVVVTPGPGIRVARIEGQAPGTYESTLSVPLGDLSAGATREIVLSLETESRRADINIEVLDAVLHFDDAIAGAGRLTRRQYVSATTSMDASLVEKSRDDGVLRAAARARAGSAALDAIGLARSGQKDDALKLLDAAISIAERDADDLDDETIREALRTLHELRESLPHLAARAELDKAEVSRSVRRVHEKAMTYTQ